MGPMFLGQVGESSGIFPDLSFPSIRRQPSEREVSYFMHGSNSAASITSFAEDGGKVFGFNVCRCVKDFQLAKWSS